MAREAQCKCYVSKARFDRAAHARSRGISRLLLRPPGLLRNGLRKMREGTQEKYRAFFMFSEFLPQKLSKLAAPDPFQSSSASIKDGSRKVGENKLLSRPGGSSASKTKNRFSVRDA
jgi:hypothetical protein